MDRNREHQSDPLLEITHGALRLSHASSAASLDGNRLVNNEPVKGQPNIPSNATNGAQKGTDFRDVAKDVDNGMLEAQVHPHSGSMNTAPKGTADHSVDRGNKQRKSALQNTLENFSPIWFSIPMNTGILGILMHQLPYQFRGLPVLSTIMYLADLTFFVIVCSMTILRWTLYPKAAQRKAATTIDEIAYYATAPIAFLALTSLTALIVSNAYWGGHAWSLVAYVMWWFGMAWMFVTCTMNLIDGRYMPPSPFLAAVGIATSAVVGGQVVNYAYDISPRLAVPVIIVAYLLGGLAIWLSVILYSVFFHRLMDSGWPEPAKRPAMMMLVGPFGQTSAAMQTLASAALTKKDFAGYHKGTFLQASAASGVSSASIVFALLLLGHDIFWLICCIFSILEGAYRRQLSYNLTWWATIFPVATVATAFLELSISMDSSAFRVLTAAFLLLLLVDYFVNWGFTLYYAFTSDLLFKKAEMDTADDEKED